MNIEKGNAYKRIPHFIEKLQEIDKTQTTEPKKYLQRLRALARNELRFMGAENTSSKEKLKLNSIRSYLTDYKNAIKRLNIIHPKARKHIIALQKKYSKKHPELKQAFDSLSADLPELRSTYLELRDTLAANNCTEALRDLKKIQIEHPCFYYLKLDSGSTEVLKTQWTKQLQAKHSNVYTVSYERILAIVKDGFNSPNFTHLALALAFATGRRAIELLVGGDFKVVKGKNELTFTGQAKTKRDKEPEPYRIPVLPGVKASEVVKQFERFRKIDSVARFADIKDDHSKGLSSYDIVNRATASNLNKWTRFALRHNEHKNVKFTEYKRMESEGLADKERMFKDTRAIYVRACLDKYYSPKKGLTEEKYAANLLGHDEKDLSTQISYKGVSIDYDLPAWDETYEPEPLGYKVAGDQLNADHLEHYDDLIEQRRSKPMKRIHEWLKDYLNNPEKHGGELPAMLSRGAIRKACNANPKTVDEYLEVIEVEL
ncbi:hypothetical protein H0A36_27840 [Endozoicomonas sp. SM1973]|uniref:Telomere resolvase ResT/TelK catalytic domain-containing protein n=1 Tax=Spartinivicinus marinus TaxID=2994442 RepID=A0A853IH36_9GAMM|nr:protelomerase family protein [Spartinivicinus marinus]NYZ69828.1 hypothetical protein [Spartinivicinus marinus]